MNRSCHELASLGDPGSVVRDAIDAMRTGGMVVLTASHGYGAHGVLTVAAAYATADDMNFMATHGRGVICVPMRAARLTELGIPPILGRHADPRDTGLHVGVDYAGGATTTGISAGDRAESVRALADPRSQPTDFLLPGHVFPVAPRAAHGAGPVGHAEAAIVLTELAGAGAVAATCSILDDAGEMAGLPELRRFATEHRLPLLSIGDLVAFRTRTATRTRPTHRAPATSGLVHDTDLARPTTDTHA